MCRSMHVFMAGRGRQMSAQSDGVLVGSRVDGHGHVQIDTWYVTDSVVWKNHNRTAMWGIPLDDAYL